MSEQADLQKEEAKKPLLESKSFDDIGMEDLTEQEFQDVFDVVELLIRVENCLRSERAKALMEEQNDAQS